jgi:hypothetical protein
MPEKTPAYFPEDCPHCGAKVWHRLSRVQSTSWAEADFLKEHEVDSEARTIFAKPGTAAAAFEAMNRDLGKAVAEGTISLNDAIAKTL